MLIKPPICFHSQWIPIHAMTTLEAPSEQRQQVTDWIYLTRQWILTDIKVVADFNIFPITCISNSIALFSCGHLCKSAIVTICCSMFSGRWNWSCTSPSMSLPVCSLCFGRKKTSKMDIIRQNALFYMAIISVRGDCTVPHSSTYKIHQIKETNEQPVT